MEAAASIPLSQCSFDTAALEEFLTRHKVAMQSRDVRGTRVTLHADQTTSLTAFIPHSFSAMQFLRQRDTFQSVKWNRPAEMEQEPIAQSPLAPFLPFFAQRRVMLGFCCRLENERYAQQFYWISFRDFELERRFPAFHCELFIISLHSQGDQLCAVCGEYFDEKDSSDRCYYHPGSIKTVMECFGALGCEDIERWTCCNEYQHENKTCQMGPHVPLQLRGFAPKLTYWEQVRLLLLWKKILKSGSELETGNALFLLDEILDAIVFLLVELNDAAFYDS
jgi:hypothetical protein